MIILMMFGRDVGPLSSTACLDRPSCQCGGLLTPLEVHGWMDGKRTREERERSLALFVSVEVCP
jgi:hypothetical protein